MLIPGGLYRSGGHDNLLFKGEPEPIPAKFILGRACVTNEELLSEVRYYRAYVQGQRIPTYAKVYCLKKAAVVMPYFSSETRQDAWGAY